VLRFLEEEFTNCYAESGEKLIEGRTDVKKEHFHRKKINFCYGVERMEEHRWAKQLIRCIPANGQRQKETKYNKVIKGNSYRNKMGLHAVDCSEGRLGAG
jgi:hypothetical protein